jgi:hypothetical protein
MADDRVVRTGIKGLDSILMGGIPRTNVILVEVLARRHFAARANRKHHAVGGIGARSLPTICKLDHEDQHCMSLRYDPKITSGCSAIAVAAACSHATRKPAKSAFETCSNPGMLDRDRLH